MPTFFPSVPDPKRKGRDNRVLNATPEGLQTLVDTMKRAHERGATDYCLHLDDQPIGVSEGTKALFGDDYFAALWHILHEYHKAMKALDPNATLYLLPTPYWLYAPYDAYAETLRAAGGLPEGCGLVFCGPAVTSPAHPIAEIRRYCEAFGATKKGLVYSNHFRHQTFHPVERLPAELADVLIGISPEVATATTRATRLDWSWNPDAYDPGRSMMLAVREYAGFEHWAKVYELVNTYVSIPPDPPELAPDTAADVCIRRLNRVGELLQEVKTLPNKGLNGRLKLPDRTPTRGFSRNLIDQMEAAYGRLNSERFRRLIREECFKKARAARTRAAPTLDGVLDDAVWKDAPAFGDCAAQGGRTATVKCLYDDENVYFGARMTPGDPITLDRAAGALGMSLPNGLTRQTGTDLRGTWDYGSWNAISLLLDPQLTRRTAYDFQLNAAGCYADAYHCTTDPRAAGMLWNSDWTRGVVIAEDRLSWTAEIAIPWKDLHVTPKPGHIMGLQLYHTAPGGPVGRWIPDVWGAWGGRDSRRFGFLILE